MPRAHRLRDGQRLAARALRGGARHAGFTQVEWDLAGRCLNPRPVEYYSKPDAKQASAGANSLTVLMHVKCRVCLPCRRARAAMWRYRARAEIQGAWRTWFGTLTLHPDRQVWVYAKARSDLLRRGVVYETLGPDEQFAARVAVVGAEITKWLKRVRKESEASLRFCLVAEAHKSGDPHFHLLVHETALHSQVGERTLRLQWKWGFSKFNLVDGPEAAGYVTKYLTKSASARVRASLHYGQHDLKIIGGNAKRAPVTTTPPKTNQSMKPIDLIFYGDCPDVSISHGLSDGTKEPE